MNPIPYLLCMLEAFGSAILTVYSLYAAILFLLVAVALAGLVPEAWDAVSERLVRLFLPRADDDVVWLWSERLFALLAGVAMLAGAILLGKALAVLIP